MNTDVIQTGAIITAAVAVVLRQILVMLQDVGYIKGSLKDRNGNHRVQDVRLSVIEQRINSLTAICERLLEYCRDLHEWHDVSDAYGGKAWYSTSVQEVLKRLTQAVSEGLKEVSASVERLDRRMDRMDQSLRELEKSARS